jgi:hypothetical protein
MWKEEVVAYSKVLFQYLLGLTLENHEYSVRVAGFHPRIGNRTYQSTKQDCQLMNRDVRFITLNINSSSALCLQIMTDNVVPVSKHHVMKV